jgi:hypothetical protein
MVVRVFVELDTCTCVCVRARGGGRGEPSALVGWGLMSACGCVGRRGEIVTTRVCVHVRVLVSARGESMAGLSLQQTFGGNAVGPWEVHATEHVVELCCVCGGGGGVCVGGGVGRRVRVCGCRTVLRVWRWWWCGGA